jgi:hypothetical protein
LHATAPRTPDDRNPPRAKRVVAADKIDRNGKTSPSAIKLDIILTLRLDETAHIVAADKPRVMPAGSLADNDLMAP